MRFESITAERALEVLGEVDLLAGVDDAGLRNLIAAGNVLNVAAGREVIRQGEWGETFYVVLDGTAVVQMVKDDGRVRDEATLGPGSYFGELAMVGHGERTASVRGETALELLELRRVPFNNALKKYKQVKGRIERVYIKRALTAFVRQSKYFRDLPEETQRDLIETSNLVSATKGDVLIKEGDPAREFHLIRSGFVRVSRQVKGSDRDEILAYLGPEDFFGDQELSSQASTYATSVAALEPVEVVVVPRATFWRLNKEHPELFTEFRRYQVVRMQQQSILSGSATSMQFVKEMLESGLGQARSALIINLDTCVRCGNCVQACDDLHGYSRIARRGKRMTRRVELEDQRRHENLYFPTSCLQCGTPECMVGCPTGAISRDPGGEVFIRDTCIGCGNCARNCDFGNISMAKVKPDDDFSLLDFVRDVASKPRSGAGGFDDGPNLVERVLGAKERRPIASAGQAGGEGSENKSDLIAVKCDVCFERHHAACVYNCPTQAILRIDPRNYFAELQRLAPKLVLREGAAAGAKTTTERPTRWIDGVLQLLAAAVTIAGGYALWKRTEPTGWSGIGWYSGIVAASMMVALALIGARKRLRTSRTGSLHRWVQVHSVLGGVFYGVVLFHAGYKSNSVLTATLLGMVTLACVMGALGQIANAIIPRLLARTEDEAQLPEDVTPKLAAMRRENTELVAALEAGPRNMVEDQVERLARGVFAAFRSGYSPKQLAELVAKRAKNLPKLPESEHAVALRVAENVMTIQLHRIRRVLELVMLSWVPIHLVASCVSLVLLAGHLLTVLLW